MKTLDSIPTGKVQRAGKIVSTGVRVGGNYVKYYSKKLVKPDTNRAELDEDNAKDIYNGLQSLRGSALKVAQMLSMEKNLLPQAYVDRFSLAQFSVPPLSAPLVRRTFKKSLGKYPEELFDSFSKESVNAASIGQVHRAEKNGRKLAVKIQYPGVANSISSDLALVKPFAIQMFNLKGKDSEKFFMEVENKLLEETDYELELERSEEITTACAHMPGLRFPGYYAELSNKRILTMDWMDGQHLGEYTATDFSPESGSDLGQRLWNFYMFQIHGLRKVHADPHPGNFLVADDGTLVTIDFGCVKEIPESFYTPYFELAEKNNMNNPEVFAEKLKELEILNPADSPEELRFFTALFKEMLSLFTRPFQVPRFNFGDEGFWSEIAALGDRYAKDPQIRKMNGNRGSRHFLYMNRTFFGLYHLLHDLKAEIDTQDFQQYLR